MQLFLILASCKGHSPLQQLVMLTLSCLCSSNSRPPPHYWSWEYRKETACWPNAGDPPHIHPFLEGECLKKVARWGHLAFSKKQRV